MLHAPAMLLIGSTERHLGKTGLVCALIRALSPPHPVTAVKVSSPHQGPGARPLDGPFRITEETRPGRRKDTQRMLKAGAHQALWLEVVPADLEAGAAALLERIGTDTLTICESNSLRTVLEPGLFLVLRGKAAEPVKASAQRVLDLADSLVAAGDGRFDLDLEGIAVVEGRWKLDASGG